MADVRLIQGDCLVEMSTIPDGTVDMILCDLPYGTTACKWDTVIPFPALWSHYKRVIKRNGAIVLTASQPFTTLLIASNMLWFKYELIWNKSRPSDFVNANHRPMKDHENICIFSEGGAAPGCSCPMPYYPQGISDGVTRTRTRTTSLGIGRDRESQFGTFDSKASNYPRTTLRFPSESRTVVPTQKPVALMEYLIRTYTNEGETVLDNCFGSCSTGVACINTNRNFIGIEKDENFFCIGSKRIAEAQAQRQLEI